MVLYQAEDLTDKCVLITGATAGIGEACAYRFAEAGCRLILLGRRTERLSQLAAAISKMFSTIPPPHCVTFDVQDIDKVADLASTFPEGYQEVDILVNNELGDCQYILPMDWWGAMIPQHGRRVL